MDLPRLRILPIAALLGAYGFSAGCCNSERQRPVKAAQAQPAPGELRVWDCTEGEYAVFNALLKRIFVDDESRGGLTRLAKLGWRADAALVLDRTLDPRLFEGSPLVAPEEDVLVYEHLLDLPERLEGATPDIAESFHRANLQPARIDQARLRVVGLELFTGPSDQYGWPRLYRGPEKVGVIILLSRPGFSKDRNRCAITTSLGFAGGFGYGTAYLKERSNGVWRVRSWRGTWIN